MKLVTLTTVAFAALSIGLSANAQNPANALNNDRVPPEAMPTITVYPPQTEPSTTATEYTELRDTAAASILSQADALRGTCKVLRSTNFRIMLASMIGTMVAAENHNVAEVLAANKSMMDPSSTEALLVCRRLLHVEKPN